MNQPSPTTDIRRDLVALLPRLRRFALTFAVSGAEADQLVRDAATRAIQKSHHWKGEGRIENWLFSLIRSTWIDEQKRRRRNDQDAAHFGAQSEDVRSAGTVFALPDGAASALLLVDVEGFSYPEAAAILGIHADMIGTRLCAARLNLAACGTESSERRA